MARGSNPLIGSNRLYNQIMRRYRSSYYKPRSLRRLENKSRRNFILTIILGLVGVYLLLSWGLPALIGGLTTLNKFRHEGKTPAVAVEDAAIAPPVLNIPYEATNTATIKISGYSSSNSKVEIYLDDALKDTASTSDDGSFTSSDLSLSLGTNNIYGKTVNGDHKSLASKTIKLIYSNDKPKLDISEPQDGAQVHGGDKKVKVSGKTDPLNSVSINGSTVIVNSDGSFASDTGLNDGDNNITIIATNPVGNSTKSERKVSYSP